MEEKKDSFKFVNDVNKVTTTPEESIKENVETKPEEKVAIVCVEEQIEARRQEILKDSKANKRWSLINMIIVVAAICGGLILFVQTEKWMKYLGIGVLGAAVLYLVLTYFLTKKKYPGKVKSYIEFITDIYNKILFPDKYYLNQEIEFDGKYDQANIVSDGVYKDVTTFYSRNLVKGEYNGHSFQAAEISMNKSYVDEKKQQHKEVVFAGVYLSLPNTLKKFEGRIVITTHCSGEKTYDLPNAIDDLKESKADGATTVYAAESGVTKIIGTHLVGAIKDIKVNDPLLNLTFVIWEGHTGVYLSYSNAIINVPFEHKCEYEQIKLAGEQIKKAFDAGMLICK